MELGRIVTITLSGLILFVMLIGVIERKGRVTDGDIRYEQKYGTLS